MSQWSFCTESSGQLQLRFKRNLSVEVKKKTIFQIWQNPKGHKGEEEEKNFQVKLPDLFGPRTRDPIGCHSPTIKKKKKK